jgi:hypothetical protein
MVSSIGDMSDAVLSKHQPVEFQILSDLENAPAFKQRLERRQRFARRDLIPAQRVPPPNRSAPSPLALCASGT